MAPQKLPALDLGAVDEQRELQRKPSFSKKMSQKFKNLVTPRGGKSSPTGSQSGAGSKPSSTATLIRAVPSQPQPAAAEPAPAAAEPAPVAAPAAPAAVPAKAPAEEAAPVPAPAPISAARVEEALQLAPEPLTPVAAEEEAAQLAASEPAAAELDSKIAVKVEQFRAQAATVETEQSKGNGFVRGLLTVGLVAAAGAVAVSLGGRSAAAKPARK